MGGRCRRYTGTKIRADAMPIIYMDYGVVERSTRMKDSVSLSGRRRSDNVDMSSVMHV